MDQVILTPRWERVPGCLRRFICLLVPLGLMVPICASAADERLEYQVKAAFLLNFTKFIEWPASAFDTSDSPIVICILGDDPFGNTLDQIVAGEVVAGRKISVQRIKRPPPLKSCQVLFVGRLEKEVLKSLPDVGPGVLTIGEGENFVHDGGMIAFVVENRRVRFGINETAAESAGLKLSSKLLSVAKSVEK
jgi:YfiR/HmsC-like